VLMVLAALAVFATGIVSNGGESVAVLALQRSQVNAGLESGYAVGH
jgi:hypothetical protein